MSANAHGTECSAGDSVDTAWSDYRDDAIALLKTMREPDPAMVAGGDGAVWERMILIALGQTPPLPTPAPAYEPPPPGTDPFHEGP